MISREQIIAEGRTWIGTPFSHQGRVKGKMVDCIGVVQEVGRTFGLVDLTGVERYAGYDRLPYMGMLRKVCDEYLVKVRRSKMLPGDIFLMGYGRDLEGHMALLSYENRIIHASCRRDVKKCTEQTLDFKWERRILGCYRYPGLMENT